MNMLSSHRIPPSIVTGYGDHGLDQSSLASPSHRMLSDRGNISNERSNLSIDRQGMLTERISFSNERSSFTNDRPSFISDRPSFASERPSFLTERSRIPSNNSNTNERSSNTNDRSNQIQRPSLSNERVSGPNERQSITNDRPGLPNGRHNQPDERHFTSEIRPVVSDRPHDRASIFERQSSRPSVSTEHNDTRRSESPRITTMSSGTDRHTIHPSYTKTAIFRGEILRGPNETQSHCDENTEYKGRFEGYRNNSPRSEVPDNDSIHPRTAHDIAFDNRASHKIHQTSTRISPKFSDNPSHVYSNYSMVSSASVRPVTVPTTSQENFENRLNIRNTHSPGISGKPRWKNYDFIDKSSEYLTTTKGVMDTQGNPKHTLPHSRSPTSSFSHSPIPDKLPPSYNSVIQEQTSTSYPYVDKNNPDNSMFLDKSDSQEKNYFSERHSNQRYRVSRSPSHTPEQLPAVESNRSFLSHDYRNNPTERIPIPVQKNFHPRNSPESYEHNEQAVPTVSRKSSVSPSNSDTISHREFSVSPEHGRHIGRSENFPYDRNVGVGGEILTVMPEKPSITHKRKSCSPDNTSKSPQNNLRLSDKHIFSEKSRFLPNSPVMVNGFSSTTEMPNAMSETQPFNSLNLNTNYNELNFSKSNELPSNSPNSMYRRPSNPSASSVDVEIPPVPGVMSRMQPASETDMVSAKSPSELNGNGNVPSNAYQVHKHVEGPDTPTESNMNSIPSFIVTNDEEGHDERMGSPDPPVVILNPEDGSSDADDVSIGDEYGEPDHDNEINIDDHDPDDEMNENSPMSMRESSMLSSERPTMLSDSPSMLSDSPSMVSAISVRPSMVTNDANCEVSMADPSSLANSEKPNVVKRGKRKKYQKYTQEDRIAIGKFCFEHGPAAARKAFQSRYPEMSESVTRGFRDKYKLMIGEYEVYCFEQKRRREMHVRTESLPRGRPRKYKQVEHDENVPTTVASVPASMSPQYQNNVSHMPEHLPEKSEREESRDKDVKSKIEYTREEKLLIGWFCAKHGGEGAMNVFKEEHPDLTLEMVTTFHKMYIESEGQITDNDKTDVFVVESENSGLQSPPSSNGSMIMSQSEGKENESREMTLGIPGDERKSAERELESASKSDDSRSNTSETIERVSPVTSPSGPVVTYPVSPHAIPPIIHYPKISDGPMRVHPLMEQRDFKQEYGSTMDHNNEPMGYPYDRQLYMYGDEGMTNGSSSLPRTKRFKYQKYSPEDRYNIGKLCNDIGLGATVKVYREQFPRLNESVVRTFRNKYRELLQKGNGVPVAEAIQRKPSRRSITTLIESEVVSQLRQFKQSNIEVNEKLVIAVAENIISTKDQKDIGPVKNTVTKEWASSLLWKHKLVERQVSNPNGVCCERCKTPLVCPKC